ncbi:TlpA disulfide reductase family protein [Lewinella sp. IMCC34191]|uniref:TlpA disulfide reductase family protein n=1 Tax=Lewinella sp. IMCC34191 TaxID=2259172 RepID=UPI000E21C7FC|nr:TlpA disulfide reductase family protein [Lewinella sp. IMCC34191]
MKINLQLPCLGSYLLTAPEILWRSIPHVFQPKGLAALTIALLFGACGPADPVPPVSTILSPASAPKIYQDYVAVAPLFEQQGDTTYLINFWATWCKPCLEELPLLQQLSEDHADDALQIILVSLDTEPSAIDRIPAYLKEQRIELPTIVLTDEGNEWKRNLDDKWDGSLPTTLIYRKELRYVYRRPFMSMPDVSGAVAPLVSQ